MDRNLITMTTQTNVLDKDSSSLIDPFTIIDYTAIHPYTHL